MVESIDRTPRTPGPEQSSGSALETYISATQVFLGYERRGRRGDRVLDTAAVVAARTFLGVVSLHNRISSVTGALKEGAIRGLVMQGAAVNQER